METRIINDHYVIKTPNPAQLEAIFPTTKTAAINGATFCAVPCTLDSARVLNNLKIKVDSPIRHKYDWPGRYTPRWYQRDTAEFFTLNSRAHCHNAPRCVDGSTEFLTPTGWKRIDQYKEGDRVAQWVQGTDRAEFVHPLEYVNMPCREMYHLRSSTGVDQMLTKGHRVPYYASTGKFMETNPERIFVADNKRMHGWRGKLPSTFLAPKRDGLLLTDEEIQVMVMTIADGWFQSNTPRCHVRVKKERKKIRARMLLAQAGIEFKETLVNAPTAKGYSKFIFTAPRREKEFTEYWWGATGHQLSIILEESRHWDSSPCRSTAFSFSSYRKASAEFIQYAAVATKRTASLNVRTRERRGAVEREYVVYVRGDDVKLGVGTRPARRARGERNITKVAAPNGRCYCFTVQSTYFIARRNGCVFVTGNTGKTLSSLWAADYLKQEDKIHRTLIVAPLSTLWDVWEQNIFESFPLRTYVVLHGSKAKRRELLARPYDFYIINHHGVALIEEDLLRRTDIDLVIIDEVATFRNYQAKTLAKPLDRVINKQGIVRSAWGLTGTPTPNAPTDAYSQCKILTPENYAGTFTSFKLETMFQVSQFKWIEKKGTAAKSVSRLLKPSIRFERTVCTDMEPVFVDRRAQLSAQQQKAYKQLLQQAMTEIDGARVTAINAAVLISKIIQTACGVVISAEGKLVKLDFGPRLSVLEELIEENEEKVLVFVPFTGVLDALATELRKRWTVAVVDGRVSAKKRTDIFNAFRSCLDPHVMVCHPRVMAHGLDLTAASLSIWYAPYTHAEVYQQANARTDGSKQEVKMDIAQIYATPEEKRTYEVLQGKGRFQDIVLSLSNSQ